MASRPSTNAVLDMGSTGIASLVLAVSGAACLLFSGSQPARAATATTTFQVTATVVASCAVSASDLAFGTYSSASHSDVNTTVDVTCTNGTTYDVALSDGGGAGATTAARKMTSASNTLTYSLYTNAGRTQVWGSSGNTVAGTGSGSSQSLTVYGRVPSGQNPQAGSYSDTIVVTVTY